MASSREATLAQNTLVIALGTYLPRLAGFVTLPILTGSLSQNEYGTYDLVSVIVALLLPALTLQIHAAAFRFLIDSRGNERRVKAIVSNVFALVLPISAVTLLAVFLVLLHLMAPLSTALTCLYFLSDIVSVDLRQVARGVGRPLDYSLSAIVAALGTLIGAVCFVWWADLGLLGAIASLALANALSAAFLFYRIKLWSLVSPAHVDMSLMREMLAYSWPMVPNELSLWVMNLSDRLIVTAVLGVSANAVYAVANKIPNLISMAQGAFTLAWQENASTAASDEDVRRYYSRMFRVVLDLQAGFFGAVIAAAPMLFSMLIRGDYTMAYQQIPILCLGVFFSCMSTFLGGIYVARMATRSIGVTTVSAAIVNIGLNALLVRSLGLYAASLSTLMSFAALFIFRMYDVRRLIELTYDIPHMIVILALLLLESAFCYFCRPPFYIVNILLAVVSGWVLNRNLICSAWRMLSLKLKSGNRGES